MKDRVSMETSAEAGFKVPFISKLLAKVQAQIKGADKQKQTIRQSLQKDIGRLQADINLLLSDAFVKLRQKDEKYNKGFLIIFDNLDRVPLNVANHLFFDYAAQLQSLHCTIIYTAPISVVYSDKNLANAFDSPNIVPMINIYEFEQESLNLKHNTDALDAVASLVERRVEIDAVF